jgi:hypothetical protein
MNTRTLLTSFLAVAALAAGARLRVVVPAQHRYPYARGAGRP